MADATVVVLALSTLGALYRWPDLRPVAARLLRWFGGFFLALFALVLLVSLVGWVCSSSAQKEEKNSAAVLSVSFLDAPFSSRPESWLVVARGASAPLRLVGHLGWVHQQEARPVGQPGEPMGAAGASGERRAEIALVWEGNQRRQMGGWSLGTLWCSRRGRMWRT